MSPWAGCVGRPVEGPARCTFTKTQGVSVIAARPMCSIMSEKPGPEVTVIVFAPPQVAPWSAMDAASSSSNCWKRPPTCGNRCERRSTTSVDGVMG